MYQKTITKEILYILIVIALLLTGCSPQVIPGSSAAVEIPAPAAQLPLPEATPTASRPVYNPGELVDYLAQTGDTLPVLAVRFNTTVEEIRASNPDIPDTATTMPPGMPMKIPIYYAPFWGTPFQMLPDGLFINGPAQVGFDTAQFIASQPGWLNGYTEYADGKERSAAGVIDLVALKFSVSPRLLLTLLEHQSHALSDPAGSELARTYPLDYQAASRKGLYRQLLWAANLLNNNYYSFRQGNLTTMEHEDGRIERYDPWQNAATVSLQLFFNALYPKERYLKEVSSEGFATTYITLFGDPWSNPQPHIPASLEQPAFLLPFEVGYIWAFTGGPHTAWGSGEPRAALDFAPPLTTQGCQITGEWATAVAAGVVARSEFGEVVLDLDGDGDERTGWNIFYLHVATDGRVQVGTVLQAGDPVGHPSCEGGTSTGTHVHIARKYNGEWIPADGTLPFNMEGWIAHNGSQPYQGTLTRQTKIVTACECSNHASFIEAQTR
jgi:LasA protease